MKMITRRIIESNTNKKHDKKRETVRAVFLNDKNETLMAHSFLFDDYTFAGGGIKGDESHEEALVRELKEEFGITDFKIIKPLGFIEEVRYGINGTDSIYLQTSYYYLCEIIKMGKANPNKREEHHGLMPVWIEIDEAINQNEKARLDKNHQQKGLKTVLIRENKMLEHLKKEIKN